MLAPLAAMASNKAKFKWGEQEQKAFDEAKNMISKETLLAYPDFTKEFHVHTDASDYQLGGVISQDGKPLAFYTRKLNSAQARYTTGEQELLGIVEMLKASKNILYRQRIVIYTDHFNLLYKKLATGRLVRWRMLLEEFGPEVRHIKGEKNVVADALSRLDMEEVPSENDPAEDPPQKLEYTFVTKEEMEEESEFPMKPRYIAKKQREDKEFWRKAKDSKYEIKKIEGEELLCYNGKIFIPPSLEQPILSWYHDYLTHPGQTRTEATLRQVYYWPDMRKKCEKYISSCHTCQVFKKQRKKYGQLPVKKAET